MKRRTFIGAALAILLAPLARFGQRKPEMLHAVIHRLGKGGSRTRVKMKEIRVGDQFTHEGFPAHSWRCDTAPWYDARKRSWMITATPAEPMVESELRKHGWAS